MFLVAIPYTRCTHLTTNLFSDKIKFNISNYYPDCDGYIAQLDTHQTTTAELIANQLYKSKIVKVFNAILTKDIVNDGKPNDKYHRRALPVAVNNFTANQMTFNLMEYVGYDYVDTEDLSKS